MLAFPFSQLITLAKPGRKRDNLVILLSSLYAARNLLLVESLPTLLTQLAPNERVLVVIDHSLALAEMEAAIAAIRARSRNAWIVALLLLPQAHDPFQWVRPDVVIFGRVTVNNLGAAITAAPPAPTYEPAIPPLSRRLETKA
jgi:hypothetical protein